MTYAKFYHDSTTYSPERDDWNGPIRLIPACGSDSVLIMDGRLAKRTMIERARAYAHRLRHVKPGYKAFRLFRAVNLRNDGVAVTAMIPLESYN